MKNPLGTYLHDHLAGATFAVELLEALRDHPPGEAIGRFASELLVEIEEDRSVLQRLSHEVEADSNGLKEAVSWLAEKATRLKLRHSEGALGTFETWEALALGILGKEALWNALAAAARNDSRLRGPDYARLIDRARAQHTKVEERRLEAAQKALAPDTTEASIRS